MLTFVDYLRFFSSTANPRVASAQAMATAVVKRPISQQQIPQVAPPQQPVRSDLPPPPPSSVLNTDVMPPSADSGAEYSHYNSKLTIENFDLLKVKYVDNDLSIGTELPL